MANAKHRNLRPPNTYDLTTGVRLVVWSHFKV